MRNSRGLAFLRESRLTDASHNHGARASDAPVDEDGLMEDRHGYYFEDLAPGMAAAFSKTITEADLLMFAGVSGDTNPLHLDEEFAAGTIFESRIAHGILTASLISTVLGTRLPGPGAIYVSQSLRFLAPVRIGDTVVAKASVRELVAERRRVTMATLCTVGDKKVLEGEAVLMVPPRRVNGG